MVGNVAVSLPIRRANSRIERDPVLSCMLLQPVLSFLLSAGSSFPGKKPWYWILWVGCNWDFSLLTTNPSISRREVIWPSCFSSSILYCAITKLSSRYIISRIL